MESSGTRDPEAASWLSTIDRLGVQFKGAALEERITLYLQVMRDHFHWPVAECWSLKNGAYRITQESHADTEPLNRFARESESIAVPAGWVNPARARIDPMFSEWATRGVFWSKHPALVKVSVRSGMIREAGFIVQVAIPVPNVPSAPHIVILFDTEMRKPGPEEIEAFSLVTLLLAWGEEPAHEAEQAFPATREPITHLDEPTRRLVGPGGAVRLTVSEWDLLSIFFANKGNAVSFQQMTREVWRAPEEHVSRTVIYEVIGRLRRHLTSVGDEYRIASVPRFGYMLEPSSSEPG